MKKLGMALLICSLVFVSGTAVINEITPKPLYSPSILTATKITSNLGNTQIIKNYSLNDSKIRVIGYGRNVCIDQNCTRKLSYTVNWCYDLGKNAEFCNINGKEYICKGGICENVTLAKLY